MLKRSKLRKISEAGKIKKEEEKIETQRLMKLYLEIWNERPHYSAVSGKYLPEPLSTIYMEHLLDKNIYPELKFEKRNIALVTYDEHSMKNAGFPLPGHMKLIDKAKRELL